MSTLAFRIREVNEADIPALARLHVHTFNETHRGGQPGGPSSALREHQWREVFERQDGSWFCYVIEDDRSEFVGFAKAIRHNDGVPGYAGELNKIDLLRRVQRQGLGRLLLCTVARRFLERGITSMLLFGDAASPANGFYEAFGAERLLSERRVSSSSLQMLQCRLWRTYWGLSSKLYCWPCFGWRMARTGGPSSMRSRRVSSGMLPPEPCTRHSSGSRKRGCCCPSSARGPRLAPDALAATTEWLVREFKP